MSAQKIHWRSSDDTKSSETKIKSLRFGEVDEGGSKTWSELMPLGPDRYPNLSGCNIITITHKLEVKIAKNVEYFTTLEQSSY